MQGVVHSVAAVLRPKPATATAVPAKAAGRRLLQLASVPAWAKPSIDLGKSISVDSSDTLNEEAADDSIDAQMAALRSKVRPYDDRWCC